MRQPFFTQSDRQTDPISHHWLQNLPLAVAILDRQLNCLCFSQQWMNDLAREPQDIIEQHSEIFCQNGEPLQSAPQRCLTEAVGLLIEKPFPRKDGSIGWRKWDLRPWRDETGEVGGVILITEDITQRKQAETTSAINEARLRDTAANLPGVIFQFTNRNEIWRVDYMSEGIWNLLGVTAEAVMQDLGVFIHHIHPDDLESFYASVTKVVEQSTPWYYEGRLIKPNGEVRWWQGNSIPTKNNQGETIFCGVMLDITERKEAELALQQAKAELERRVEERTFELQQVVAHLQKEIHERQQVEATLRASEAELQAIIDNCPSIIFLKDPQERILRVNRQFEAVVKKTKAEIIGKNSHDLFPKEIADVYRKNDQKILTEGKPILAEEMVLHEDGLHTYLASKFALFNAEGFPYAIGGIATDISDHKALETQLKVQKARFDAFFAAANAGLVILDEELRYVHVNEALANKNGLPITDHINKSIKEVVPDLAPILEPMLREILQTGKPVLDYELVGKTPNQSGINRYWLASYYPLLGQNGEAFGIGGVVIDISDRKCAEEHLRKERDFNQKLIQTTPAFFVAVREDGTVRMMNEAMLQALGYNKEEVVGKDYLKNFVPESDRRFLKRKFQQIVTTGKVDITENHILTKSGAELLVEWRGTPIYKEDGSLDYFFRFGIDITERRKAEKEQAKLVAILEAATDFIGIADIFGKTLYINQFGRQLLGIKPDEDISDRRIAHYHPAWANKLLQQEGFPVAMRTGYWRGETAMIAADGTEIPFSQVIIPHKSETGEVEYFSTIARDIRDRKRIEAELSEREQFLRSIYEGTENVIFVLDVQEDGTVRNAGWNPAGERVIGLSNAEAIGKAPEEIFGSIEGGIIHQQYQQCVKTGLALKLEESFTLHGQEKWFLTTVNPLKKDSGLVYRLVGTSIDITERKLAEVALQEKATQLEQTLRELQHTQAQLVQTEKMSSLGQLVAGVAHEINNPVNFIYGNLTHATEYMQQLLGLLELYQEHYSNPHEEIQDKAEEIDLEFLIEDLPKLLSSMKVGADRIQKIVLALRNFSRMDEAEVKQIDIHEGIDSTLMILHNRLKDKSDRRGIEVIKDYGKLPLVECYAGQLNQVFMNVLSNAIDALDERDSQRSPQDIKQNPSRITIRTQLLNPNQVQIRIADNGLGITETVRKRLFEPFFTTKAVGKGTGLGLSISYQVVVEKHGGQLECVSLVGKGTDFLITLPLVAKLKT